MSTILLGPNVLIRTDPLIYILQDNKYTFIQTKGQMRLAGCLNHLSSHGIAISSTKDSSQFACVYQPAPTDVC